MFSPKIMHNQDVHHCYISYMLLTRSPSHPTALPSTYHIFKHHFPLQITQTQPMCLQCKSKCLLVWKHVGVRHSSEWGGPDSARIARTLACKGNQKINKKLKRSLKSSKLGHTNEHWFVWLGKSTPHCLLLYLGNSRNVWSWSCWSRAIKTQST